MKPNVEKQISKRHKIQATFKLRYQCERKCYEELNWKYIQEVVPQIISDEWKSFCYPLKQAKKFWSGLEPSTKAFPLKKSDFLQNTANFFFIFPQNLAIS